MLFNMKQSTKRTNIASILLILLSHQFISIDAWGTLGHEMVGNLAWYHLSPQAKLWVNDTLKLSTRQEDDPTMTPLGQVSDWADQVRHYLGWSGPLHFIDVRDDLVNGGCVSTETTENCRFQYERDCPNDVCVAGAIMNYTKQLMNVSPDHRRHLRRQANSEMHSQDKEYNLTQSLMFLTHFIGDIHQPLHASRKSDKGGNDYNVHFDLPVTNNRHWPFGKSHHHSWNLHSVWDTAIIEVVLGRNYNHSRHLMEQDLLHSESYTNAFKKSSCNVGINATCVIGWGEESFALALQFAYVESDNVTQVSSGSTLDELYYESRLPIIKQQLVLGGIRLAETIEAIVQTTGSRNKKESAFAEKFFEIWRTLGLATTIR